MPAPMPDAPPVTNATLPLSPESIISSRLHRTEFTGNTTSQKAPICWHRCVPRRPTSCLSPARTNFRHTQGTPLQPNGPK
jgi:hypothetical protein